MNKVELGALLKAAELASLLASPIKSGIRVGAVYRINNGGIYKHVASGNVEFSGAPTVHGEVAGLCKLLSLGFRPEDVECLCLYFKPKLQPPCGCCLQALASYFPNDFQIISCSKEEHRIDTLQDLLPFMYRRKNV